MTPSHVLVPLDGSPLADDALVYALDVFDCRITVLNIVTPIDAEMSEGGVLEPETPRIEDARERAERLIERARRRAEAADRSVETAIETGEPAETILAYVEAADVDQVVMGSHGGPRTGIVRRLLGTVATTVTGEAPVPVTVVR
ncbi:Nucleotide-binding protein, UspA family [Halalkaliarchaeum sp. AArc-CO]|uniref:universal stress protein n=1 Tax=unclassified Halalkaliarchaeum TaxID=2678344 RepID=UPI00217EFDEC|nr:MULTISPECIES: universal stress protein [unclassified Halalkaliarchaeum]MDR5674330.1 universal stress protein [Halalkaliarchaeum sp. AArc-GB]UWG50753.1 Nucleotide-binding protein, UspA family [Halalkaliarchaeum sp. AArc-CO]